MPFQKGHKKTGGRPKGAPNRDKRVVKEIVEAALGRSLPEEILSHYVNLKSTKPVMAAKIAEGLMPYCYPKLQSIEVDGSLGGLSPEQEKEVAELTALLKETKKL